MKILYGALFVLLAGFATAAEVSVADFYPQGLDYVFVCETDSVAATSYDWDFGDGTKLYDQTTNDVYHSFAADGIYQVTCAAADDGGAEEVAYLIVETAEAGELPAEVPEFGVIAGTVAIAGALIGLVALRK